MLSALSALAREYDAGQSTTAWVLTGFLLSAPATTPMVGKLGDLYGRGRVLGGVLLIFCAGGLVSALATDIGVLIAGRTLQGVAGAVFPLAYGSARLPVPERVPGAVSPISAVYGIGAGIGLPPPGVIVVWMRVKARWASPLIRLDVLTRPAIAATNLTAFMVGVAMISGFLLIPQLAQAPRDTGYGLGGVTPAKLSPGAK